MSSAVYVPSEAPPKVVIAGGGYAGIAALITLYRCCPSADVTLIDPRQDHFKITICTNFFGIPGKFESPLRSALRAIQVSACSRRPSIK